MDDSGKSTARNGENPELERLTKRLTAHDHDERLSAVSGLADLGTPEALTVLAQSLETPNAIAVTEAVVQALALSAPTNRLILEDLRRQAESDAARARLTEALQLADRQARSPANGIAGSRPVARPARPDKPLTQPMTPRADRALPAVPWGLRDSILGTVVAMFPVTVPALVTWIAGLTATAVATTAVAVAVVVGQLLYDGWWLVWAWVFSLRKFKLSLSAWGFRRPKLSALWLVPIVVVAATIVDVIYARLAHPPAQVLVAHFPHTVAGLVLLILSACVCAPLFEETFFRGFLFQGLASWRGPLLAAALSSALWSAGHRQLSIFLPLFVTGLLMCWAFRRSGSLWTTIAIHMAMNVVAVLGWASVGLH